MIVEILMVRKPDRGESVVNGRENSIVGTRSRETTDSQMKSATSQVSAPYYLFSLLGAGNCGGKTVPTLVSSVRYMNRYSLHVYPLSKWFG